ncbi:hypothetical protein Trydic_g22886 [Trypoxylus dichotomus]
MPARYFFIEFKNYEWDNQTSSDLKIVLQGYKEERSCRIRTNLLDRKDGFYIFRYKLYENCDTLQINVMYRGLHVAHSPYNFNHILSHDCNCPVDINIWLKKWQCPVVPNKILKDLNEFSNTDWRNLRQQVIDTFNKPGSISLCDWPLSSLAAKYPIFSWCGSTESFDIVMPTYDITKSSLENLGRVTLDMLSVQGNVNKRWRDRTPKAFWRGRDSNKERLKLVSISREYPDLYNVSLTNFFFFRDKEEIYGPKADHISFFDFFDYKYQVNIDGTVAAYRLPYLLGGGSLVFKQDSLYYEHFYDDLIPNIHYIPVKRDLSDLTEKIKWAIENDDVAQKISIEGQKFAVHNLLPRDIFCYYSHLINEFSKTIVSPVIILSGMELVEPSDVIHCQCKIKDEL